MLCQYKDLFGKVDTGVHSYRIFNIAVVDVVLTFIVAYLIYRALYPKYKYHYYIILCILFVVGIISHRVFCVRTTIDKLLFGNSNSV